MKKENRKYLFWVAGALWAALFVVGYIQLGYAWAVLIALAVCLAVIGLAARSTERINANIQHWLALSTACVLPLIAGVVAYTQSDGKIWWVLSVLAMTTLLMIRAFQSDTAKTLLLGAALALLSGISLHYSWWWTVAIASALLGGVMLWKQFNPPDLREAYQQIEWDQDVDLPVSVLKFGKLPTDYARVLACDRRHWTMIIDPEPWRFGTRLITLLIGGAVLLTGWGQIPFWAILALALASALYGFQNLLAWIFKYVLVLEDQEGEKRLMLVPSHPFYRKILAVKESDLKTPQTITGTIGNLFGYVGYELGTLNERDDETERKLQTEFRRLPDVSRSALVINNF